MKALVLFFLLLPLSSFAKWEFGSGGPSHSSGGGGGGIGLGGIKFRLLGNLKLSRASMMSKDDFVEKRTLNSIGADSVAGINIGPLIVGAGAAYTMYYQATDKKDVSGTDTSGSMTSIHGVAGLAFGKLCLLGRYIFKADYSLSQKTSTGDKETFSKPTGSYGLSLMYRPGGRSFWSVDYTNINFTEVKVGSSKTKLSGSDQQINLNSFGISYGFMF